MVAEDIGVSDGCQCLSVYLYLFYLVLLRDYVVKFMVLKEKVLQLPIVVCHL